MGETMTITTDSLCCGVCKLDGSGTYCIGCFRTRTDIGAWSMATDTEKLEINKRAHRRAADISAAIRAKKST